MARGATTPSPSAPRATDRGLRLVVVVADHPDGIALADAARAVELSASTTLRQLRSLEGAGFAVRLDDGRWVPGPELLRLARSLTSTVPLTSLAEDTLRSLSRTTGESAYLAEPADARTAIYVAAEAGIHSVRHVSWIGQTVPRRGSAVGRALADDLDPDGVAVRLDAVEPGITAVSAPVRDRSRQVIAAISVVGPSFRLSGAALATARTAVAAHALRLSRLAGSP